MTQVVFHKPLLGYANNFDFIKISSTLGIWVDEPGVNPTVQHPSAPYSHYRAHGERIESIRYLSSELLLVYPAIIAADVLNWLRGVGANGLDLRTVGTVKACFFLGAGIFLTLLFFRRSPSLGVVSALIFALVICDPFNTLYFNALYFDDATLLFSYLAVALAVFCASAEQQSALLIIALFCTVLLLAGLSKMQHAGLPLAIALAFCAAQAKRRWPNRRAMLRALAPVAAAFLALGLGVANHRLPSMQGMVAGAATDAWFATVLPALDNPKAVLRSFRLPERCDAAIGKSWYDPGMQPAVCPEIFHVSRFQMARTLLREPAALWRVLKRAVPSTRPFVIFYGQVEGRNFGRIEEEGLRFASLGRFVGELRAPVYVALFGISLLGGVLSLALLMAGRVTLPAVFSTLLLAVVASTFAACLMGTGYIDLARHFHLGQNALLLSFAPAIVVIGRVLIWLGRRLIKLRSDSDIQGRTYG